VAKYAQRSVINEYEVGSVERFRFITSPGARRLPRGAGAAVAGTSLFGTSNADVYPIIVVGEYGVFDVALRGSKSFDMSILTPSQKDKSDILGQRGTSARSSTAPPWWPTTAGWRLGKSPAPACRNEVSL
jgi:N4-gp56 family major capsid protein